MPKGYRGLSWSRSRSRSPKEKRTGPRGSNSFKRSPSPPPRRRSRTPERKRRYSRSPQRVQRRDSRHDDRSRGKREERSPRRRSPSPKRGRRPSPKRQDSRRDDRREDKDERRDRREDRDYRRDRSRSKERDRQKEPDIQRGRRRSSPEEELHVEKVIKEVEDKLTLNERFTTPYDRPFKADENITIGIQRNIRGNSPAVIPKHLYAADVVVPRRKDEGSEPIFDRDELLDPQEEVVERRIVAVLKPENIDRFDKYEQQFQREKAKERGEKAVSRRSPDRENSRERDRVRRDDDRRDPNDLRSRLGSRRSSPGSSRYETPRHVDPMDARSTLNQRRRASERDEPSMKNPYRDDRYDKTDDRYNRRDDRRDDRYDRKDDRRDDHKDDDPKRKDIKSREEPDFDHPSVASLVGLVLSDPERYEDYTYVQILTDDGQFFLLKYKTKELSPEYHKLLRKDNYVVVGNCFGPNVACGVPGYRISHNSMIFMTGCFRVKQNLLDSYFDAPEISLKEVLKSERWVRCSLRGRVTSYQLVRSTGGKKSEKSEFMLEQKGDVLKVKMWNSKSELIVQSDAGKLVLLRNMVIDLWKLKKWNRYSAVSTLETTVTFLDPLVSTDSPGGDHPLSRSPSPLTNTEEPKEKNDSNKDGKEPNVVSSTDNVQDNKADKTALNDSKGDEGDVDLYGDV